MGLGFCGRGLAGDLVDDLATAADVLFVEQQLEAV
jgi:hypothetical protein